MASTVQISLEPHALEVSHPGKYRQKQSVRTSTRGRPFLRNVNNLFDARKPVHGPPLMDSFAQGKIAATLPPGSFRAFGWSLKILTGTVDLGADAAGKPLALLAGKAFGVGAGISPVSAIALGGPRAGREERHTAPLA